MSLSYFYFSFSYCVSILIRFNLDCSPEQLLLVIRKAEWAKNELVKKKSKIRANCRNRAKLGKVLNFNPEKWIKNWLKSSLPWTADQLTTTTKAESNYVRENRRSFANPSEWFSCFGLQTFWQVFVAFFKTWLYVFFTTFKAIPGGGFALILKCSLKPAIFCDFLFLAVNILPFFEENAIRYWFYVFIVNIYQVSFNFFKNFFVFAVFHEYREFFVFLRVHF